MRSIPSRLLPPLLLAVASLGACAAPPAAECVPTIESPWVRAAPPGVQMLAGYAIVRNDCAAPVTLVAAESQDFASASLHATTSIDGASRMRPAGSIVVAPGASVALAPGGTHVMLMGPQRALPEGDRVRIRLVLADGRKVPAEFRVQREATKP
jgi:copper(I)-binding protein